MDTALRMATICMTKMIPQMRVSSGNSGFCCFLAIVQRTSTRRSPTQQKPTNRSKDRHTRAANWRSLGPSLAHTGDGGQMLTICGYWNSGNCARRPVSFFSKRRPCVQHRLSRCGILGGAALCPSLTDCAIRIRLRPSVAQFNTQKARRAVLGRAVRSGPRPLCIFFANGIVSFFLF